MSEMATRQADMNGIVARAKRIGWSVRPNRGGGWKIYCPDGYTVPIHLTVSRTGLDQALADLNDRGFAEAEEAFNKKAEAERQRRLAEDAKRNEAATQRAQVKALAHHTARETAAGPYGQTMVSIDEILGEHPGPRTYTRVLVTPAMATRMLERNHPTEKASWPNRPLYPLDIAVWEAELRAGNWLYTHQGVAFDEDGRLQDGQNRLAAIVQSGVTAEMMISVGMSRKAFPVVDAVRKRTAGQVLRMAGFSNSNPIAAAVRVIHLYETWGRGLTDHANHRILPAQIERVADELDQDDLEAALAWAQDLRREILVPLAAPTAAMYLIRRKLPIDDPRVKQFAHDLVVGVVGDDREQSPIYQLRRMIYRARKQGGRSLGPAQQFYLIIRGWNAFAQGNHTRTGFHAPGRNAVTPPIFLPPPLGTPE